MRIGAVTAAGDEQDVGVTRCVGEEEPEPLDVVVGVPERLDLPLLAAVRSAVDVTDVDRAAQPRAEFPEWSVSRGARSGISGEQTVARSGGRLESLVAEREMPAGPPYALAAQNAASVVETKPTRIVDGDRAGGAQALHVLLATVGVQQFHPRVEPGGRGLWTSGIAGGDAPAADPAKQPGQHQRSAPAGVSPKLCSMKAKSVSTSLGKAWSNSAQLRKEGEARWTFAHAAFLDLHPDQQLALRRLGPAAGTAAGSLRWRGCLLAAEGVEVLQRLAEDPQ